MSEDRWEVGSALHWMAVAAPPQPSVLPWANGRWLGTGRQALRLVVELGYRKRGWRRLWIPSYFCQDVARALVATGIRLEAYPDQPGRPIEPPETHPGDALLVHSGLGLRAGRPAVPVDVIEDHTHSLLSPWARGSDATFCIASLRKLLPVADGGVAWSPAGLALPSIPKQTDAQRRATETRLQGMLLKAHYLAGLAVDKSTSLHLLDAGEAAFADGDLCLASALTRALVPALPFVGFEQAHRDNYARLSAALIDGGSRCVVLAPEESAAPFCAFVVFGDAATRDRVRRQLAAKNVYASALWPLDPSVVNGIPDEDRDLSARSFCLPVDARYDGSDMDRIVEAFRCAE